MADGYVQVPPDSSGKKIDSVELSTTSGTVERQRVSIPDGVDAGGEWLTRILVEQRLQNTLLAGGLRIKDNIEELRDELSDIAGLTIPTTREILTANRSYYVRTSGSNSNTGLTSDAPWLTLQHAMSFIASSIDFAGFTITVNIGTGSFVGFGTTGTVGGGNLFFKGNGSSNTIITNGPNDGVLNFGECISLYIGPGTSAFFLNAVTLKSSSANTILFAANNAPGGIGFCDVTAFTVDLIFDITSASGGSTSCIQQGGPILTFTGYSGGAITLNGTATIGAMITLNSGTFQNFADWTINNTPTFSNNTIGVNFSFLQEFGSYTGAASGIRYFVADNGAIETFGGGANVYPGDVAGSTTSGGIYA